MRALFFALGLITTPAMAAEQVDHRSIDVPAQYRGTWALDPALCKERSLGPAFVQIGARRVSFYEEHGYLELAQLNEAGDVPEFFGKFSFVRGLSFSDEVIRLDMSNGKLLITRHATHPDDEPSAVEWTKCSADEGA